VATADDLVDAASRYAAAYPGARPVQPRLHLAVVACMDSRMDVFALLGLKPGDAHVLRNAGGIVTDDVMRSLTVSQRRLGTREIVLVHHTDCGMQGWSEDEFKEQILAETGLRPTWALESFVDVERDVRQSMERLRRSPFLLHKDAIRAFVFDVSSGTLREVS
jgi:carbonic anhydrase